MKRILVVEDNTKINNLICEALKTQNDYHVDSAIDGLSGMLMIKEKEYDILITDLNLPYMDGLELIKRVRCFDKGLNIIVLSALDQEHDELSAFDLGINDYIIKPFSINILLKRVEVQLRQNNEHRRNKEILNIFKK